MGRGREELVHSGLAGQAARLRTYMKLNNDNVERAVRMMQRDELALTRAQRAAVHPQTKVKIPQ